MIVAGRRHLQTKGDSALEALRNALYKCSTYLLTYLLDSRCLVVPRLYLARATLQLLV